MKNQIGYLIPLALHVGCTISHASFAPLDPQAVAAQYRFDREQPRLRAVHAGGVGGQGTFTVTTNFSSQYTMMDVLNGIGKQTPISFRLSNALGDKGAYDTARNILGFGLKFRTNQGIWDLLMNNTPIFFLRDPAKFPILIHSQVRSAVTNLPDPDQAFGFLADNPESLNQFIRTLSDAGISKGWLHANAFTGHAYRWIKSDGSWVYVKLSCRSNQGTSNFTRTEQAAVQDPYFAAQEIYTSIKSGKFPSWTLFAQVLTPAQASKFRYDVLDVTKEWPSSLVEPHEIGRFEFNKNPSNYFTEVEQLAFSPSNVVQGWAPSDDPILQMRLLAYPDANRYRLGSNYRQIPVNCYMKCPAQISVDNSDCQRSTLADGQIPTTRTVPTKPDQLPDIDYEQPRYFYGNLTSDQKSELINSFVKGLSGVQDHDIRSRVLDVIHHASPELASRISVAL